MRTAIGRVIVFGATLAAGLTSLSGGAGVVLAATAETTPAPSGPAPGGLTLSAPSLDWGNVYLGRTLDEQLRLLSVTNETDAPISLARGPVSGPGSALFSLKTGDPTTPLLPQQTALFAWGYKPTAAGAGSAAVSLTAGALAATVPFSATALALPAPAAAAAPPAAPAPAPASAPTITVNSTTVPPGGWLQVSWSGLTDPTPTDYIGLLVPGTPAFFPHILDSVYTNGQSSGTIILLISGARAPGQYELRLLRNDGPTAAAVSSPITVTASPDPAPVFGPRYPLGPDVPLSTAETAAFARRVTVPAGGSNLDIQTACDQAAKQGIPVVFLPAGHYSFSGTVNVPGGITLLGEGSRTLCYAYGSPGVFFTPVGSNVRFTRLTMQGTSLNWTDASGNDSGAVQAAGLQNIRVDHCDLSGFAIATEFDNQATAQVDHCSIHDNQVIGTGYGVSVNTGAYVLVADNEFGDCRSCLASNGDPKGLGYRPTHWEFVHNRVNNLNPSNNQHAAVDTHPGMDGSFLVEGNIFTYNNGEALGLYAGSGLIRSNLFSQLYDAIYTNYTSDSGGHLYAHDINIEGNTFVSVSNDYDINQSVNIVTDGMVVPSTYWPASSN